MRAALIENYGPAQDFSIGECPRPDIGEDDVLVRVHATSVNPVDWKIRDGMMGQQRFPMVLGQDFAGVVDRAGEKVQGFPPGKTAYEAVLWAG